MDYVNNGLHCMSRFQAIILSALRPIPEEYIVGINIPVQNCQQINYDEGLLDHAGSLECQLYMAYLETRS